MSDESNIGSRPSSTVRLNQVHVQQLQADLNMLKLILELQGLRVEPPKRIFDPDSGNSMDATAPG